MGVILNGEMILTARKLPTEDVECPELGGTVRVRALSGAERDSYESVIAAAREKAEKNGNPESMSWFRNMRTRLIAMSMIDEEDQRVFPDPIAEDVIEELGKQNGAALARIGQKCHELSGFSEKKN